MTMMTIIYYQIAAMTRLLILFLLLGQILHEVAAASNVNKQNPSSSLARNNRLKIGLVTQRWHEELQTIGDELRRRGHLVKQVNSTSLLFQKNLSLDVTLFDRRFLMMSKTSNNNKNDEEIPNHLLKRAIIIDNDMLLDCDFPTLSVPAPFSKYGKLEIEFKESTFTRVKNALDRLSFHVSPFGRSRKLKSQLVIISMSSFILETVRPIPPWLQVVGPIQRWGRLKRIVKPPISAKANGRVVIYLGSFVEPKWLVSGLLASNAFRNQKEWIVATSAPFAIVDPNNHLRNNILKDANWMENVDLHSLFPNKKNEDDALKVIITSSDIRSVLNVLSIGAIPLVISHRMDAYSQEMANALKRRGLGASLNEEPTIYHENDSVLFDSFGVQIAKARQALVSPSETNGLKRAIEIIEAIGGGDQLDMITSKLTPDIPPWYQYWFLDVYAVYGLVMACVFVLVGSLATASSTLFVQ